MACFIPKQEGSTNDMSLSMFEQNNRPALLLTSLFIPYDGTNPAQPVIGCETGGHHVQLRSSNSNERGTSSAREMNYIYQILMQTFEGQFMIAAYDFEAVEANKQKLLQTKKQLYFSKNKIGKLVVDDEFLRTKSFSITAKRFKELARWCAELFPSYMPESFYFSQNKSKSSGGALYIYYLKQREKEIAIGRLKVRGCKRKRSDEEIAEPSQLKELQTTIDVIDEDFINKWRTTAIDERIRFFQNTSDINVIFDKYPVLTNPLGYKLIQSDFCTLFNKPINIFSEKWALLTDSIIDYAKTRKSKIDQSIKDLLAENSTLHSTEHKQIVALMLLPHLFKRYTKLTSRSKGKNWNPERSEITKTFIYHLKKTKNLKYSLNEIQDELYRLHDDHQLTLQPYVVIYGPTLSSISSAYVIMGSHQYQVPSVPTAVDICFQFMKVFNKKYSIVCNHIWQFLETKVYQFPIKEFYAAVTNVLEKLNKYK